MLPALLLAAPRFIGILEDKKIRRGIIIFSDAMSPPARKVRLYPCHSAAHSPHGSKS